MPHEPYRTVAAAEVPPVPAPDGATVLPLLALDGLGSFARFDLPPGAVTRAVSHATVQELWYVTEGSGRLWRSQDGTQSTVDLRPGTAVSIPLGTAFQFRAEPTAAGPLRIVAVTMPPWPQDTPEARPEQGPWTPTFD
ncbi:cupin domain-containing protein [Kitasatospora sp. NPDC048540]|uniref:cupin domain-containing protein n=1 Tax=unclassified Kitasatospora TaxID=2633591 RepID=UPI000692476C|nr:cupin domain-containing protein [Kitasatospora sp. MBT63]